MISLRTKAMHVFGKDWKMPPINIRAMPFRVTKFRTGFWNPNVQNPMEFVDHHYPITDRRLLRRKLRAGSMNLSPQAKAPAGVAAAR